MYTTVREFVENGLDVRTFETTRPPPPPPLPDLPPAALSFVRGTYAVVCLCVAAVAFGVTQAAESIRRLPDIEITM